MSVLTKNIDMRTVKEILNEMKPLMGTDNAAERERLTRLEEELTARTLTDEERATVQAWYAEGIAEIKDGINEMKEQLKIRDQLKESIDIIPLSYIARTYFGKSASWLYQRINGNKVRGKVYTLNADETAIFNRALKEIGNRISSLSVC